MRTPLALLLLAALLAAPLAAGHVENYSQARTLAAGDYLVYMEPKPAPPFANKTLSFSALLSRASDGGIETRAPAALVVTGPGGFNQTLPMRRDGTGYLLASMTPRDPGVYMVRVEVTDPATNVTHSTETDVEVFPDLPFRIRAVDEAQDVTTGRIVPLAFQVVDPTTFQRMDPFQDVTVRIERWTNDHSSMLGFEEVEPKKDGTGLWKAEYRFPQAGMYHIRFASEEAGFTYADVPLLHLYATDPPPAEEKSLPAPAALAALAVLGAVALALRRRG